MERTMERLGVLQVRCRDCDERFTTGVVNVRHAAYSKCPRCERLDLGTWKLDHYHLTFVTRALLRVGGKPRRCEACRCNFVSFRAVKVQHVRRQKRSAAMASTAVEAARF
jgi:hypothetical protein